jgi:hypothetical protein
MFIVPELKRISKLRYERNVTLLTELQQFKTAGATNITRLTALQSPGSADVPSALCEFAMDNC